MIPSSKPLRSTMHCKTIYHTASTTVLYPENRCAVITTTVACFCIVH